MLAAITKHSANCIFSINIKLKIVQEHINTKIIFPNLLLGFLYLSIMFFKTIIDIHDVAIARIVNVII